ncbi:MAG: hypothetical protein IT579_21810 [Verrucomicrobia subdivision 3 bacterium]|nr:hypothetical protein [Limisphaerales bacterium]
MSDVQLLFFVLAGLYVWECTGWLRRGSVAFVTWLGGNWRVVHPGALAGNPNGGFILAAPLPPLGTLLVANQLPLSFSPHGVLAFVATNVNPGWRPAQTGCFLRWEQLDGVVVHGKKLIINGELFLVAATPSFARHLKAELERLAKLTPALRGAAVAGMLRAMFDERAIESRQQEYRIRTPAVRRLSNALFVYLVVIVPGLIWYFGFGLTWLGLLLGLLALTVATASLFYRAHRALYPNATDERFTHTLTIALAPSSALRAHDALSRPLLEHFHPLAVARRLLPDNEFRTFARRVLLDLRHPARPWGISDQPEVVATEAYSRCACLKAAEEFLTLHGLAPGELGRAPVPTDASCRSYCPRCDAQFTAPRGECADCGGLAVVELPRGGGS